MPTEVFTLERRIFRNKTILLFALAFCVSEVVLSGRSISRQAPSIHDWIYIGGLLFSVWIVGALTFRTKFVKERLLLAPVLMAFILWTVLALRLPPQPIVYVLRWIIVLMWASAVVGGTVVLLTAKNS